MADGGVALPPVSIFVEFFPPAKAYGLCAQGS